MSVFNDFSGLENLKKFKDRQEHPESRTLNSKTLTRVPMPPEKSRIVFLENSSTWKVAENHVGPGKSWKLKLKVLEKYP